MKNNFFKYIFLIFIIIIIIFAVYKIKNSKSETKGIDQEQTSNQENKSKINKIPGGIFKCSLFAQNLEKGLKKSL